MECRRDRQGCPRIHAFTLADLPKPAARRFTATGRLSDTGSAAKLVFGGSKFATDLKRVVCVSAGGRGRIAGDGSASCGTTNE